MGNDTPLPRPPQRSHLDSSTESLDKMDTSDTTSPYLLPHTCKDDCPTCSGLCARRSPRSLYPPNGVAGNYQNLSKNEQIKTLNDNRSDHSHGTIAGSNSSYSNANGWKHGASSHWAPPLDNAGGSMFNGAGRSLTNYGGAVKPFMNSSAGSGAGATGSYASAHEAGYNEGLNDGYELAMEEIRRTRANATENNDPEHSHRGGSSVAGRDHLAHVGDDNAVGDGSFNGSYNKPINSNNLRKIPPWSETAALAGPSDQASSAVGGNMLGISAAEKKEILKNAAKRAEDLDSVTSAHSSHEEDRSSHSVRSKHGAKSHDNSTKTQASTRSLVSVVRNKFRGTSGQEFSSKGMKNLYPSHPLEDTTKQEKFRQRPASHHEKLLAEHTTEVCHQPPPSIAPSKRRASSTSRDYESAAAADCSICLASTAEESSYQTDKDVSRDLVGCVALKLCGHHFHTSCLVQMASHDTSCLTCPNCQTIHGVRMGTQPQNGSMVVRKNRIKLPGYKKSKGTIEITYSFPHGNQGPEHPSPGRPYYLVGFPRVAYLPDTSLGNKVLNLLQVAFNRRLIFTVGTSATSGSPDCVVWNGIHHKTETSNYSGHGYPDPKYLDNVLMELASFGITG